MKETAISACYVSPSLSTEQFVPDHCFMYLIAGTMLAYDGSKEYKIKGGDYGLARRNHLAKYTKQPDNGAFKKIYILFEQDFLKEFQETYKFKVEDKKTPGGIIPLKKNALVKNFIQSLTPYFNEHGTIDEQFLNVKRSELLLVLLKNNPELANILFDFSTPEKIDLEAYMNRNYKFNVRIERFAYLTGRSLSAFKRDFEKIFNATPSHWLVQKRLEEAYHLIDKKNKKPSEIYLDLGFEDLSHFSFAFKKLFGHSPTKLTESKNTSR
ncbi:helix-turn-helix transcriptional regulator [Pedobacter riviphilus]|uniref:Helix-turn-helix transcriptional regulator n=1 Tax=Pedobacter riviphilus TaxID=2766984 RepID=A0ABX6THX0_9SPHI|nr:MULTISPECIES: AraC family transcriptional regulator [Pedobacter]NII81067.1 AraC-like DNA-binding protein [Pedobacter sp. SG908]NMN35084.1 AraC-like DNA-binding protein [Pedobacter sp. SG918]QNR85058.1 helix-turn-helix transcriptional regulator [Pedobacter riviphilus]